MRRPWFSMFTGILSLFTIIIFGVFTASILPPGISERVTIFRVEPGLKGLTACEGRLTPGGVRGSIIGWSDGFFNSWNQTYYGHAVN